MTDSTPASSRGSFGSKFGFVLAAAGSAIGLGNIWKFPYICGENGGGAFVLIYLVCIAAVGFPIMVGEIMLGRRTQRSPVGAYGAIAGPMSPWQGVGFMGVVAAFLMLSFYSIVAGWALHYTYLSLTSGIAGTAAEINAMFGEVLGDWKLSIFWHVAFMALTILIVIGGVKKGIERWASILMPALFLMLIYMLVKAVGSPGFEKARQFVFGFHTDKLTPAGVLEALGHAFFTLSLGMGAMITYGSYMRRDTSLVSNVVWICVLDTVIALLACMILFPITFTYDMPAAAGPGLVFKNIPVALSQMAGGGGLSIVFFGLLVFAALTSAISLLEVVASYFIDQRGWSRKKATVTLGIAITAFGIPSALSGVEGGWFHALDWRILPKPASWFDTVDHLVSNWMLPLGGLGVALFCAWRLSDADRRAEFAGTGTAGSLYSLWLLLLRYLVPIIVIVVFLTKAGLVDLDQILKMLDVAPPKG